MVLTLQPTATVGCRRMIEGRGDEWRGEEWWREKRETVWRKEMRDEEGQKRGEERDMKERVWR